MQASEAKAAAARAAAKKAADAAKAAEGKDDDEEKKGGDDDDDDDDSFDPANLQPPDAFSLSTQELILEMERVGLRAKGFFQDDAKAMQAVYEQEHEQYVIDMRRKRAEDKIAQQRAALEQKKRAVMERLLDEEMRELSEGGRAAQWLQMCHRSTTPAAAHMLAPPVACRALAKALCATTSLTDLNLARNGARAERARRARSPALSLRGALSDVPTEDGRAPRSLSQASTTTTARTSRACSSSTARS